MSHCPQLLTPQEEIYMVSKEIIGRARSLFYASYNDALCQPEVKLTRTQLAYAIRNFDYYYAYSDDNSVYKAGKRMEGIIISHSKYPELSDLVNLVTPYHTGDEEARKVVLDILEREGPLAAKEPDITDLDLLDESVQVTPGKPDIDSLRFRKAFVDYLGKGNVPSDVILQNWRAMMTYGSILGQIYRYTDNFPSRGKPFKLYTSFAPNFVEDAEGNKRPFITLAMPQELQEKLESFNNGDFASCFGILDALSDKISNYNCPAEMRLLNRCRFRKANGIMYLIASRASYLDEFEDLDHHADFKIPVKPFNNFIRKIPSHYWI